MAKFKVGDKVRRVENVELFVERVGSTTAIVESTTFDGSWITVKGYDASWDSDWFELESEPQQQVKHVHCDVIKAWAEGAEIEFKRKDGAWALAPHPTWLVEHEYRIKREPVVQYIQGKTYGFATCLECIAEVKILKDPYTGEIISVEMLKKS
jgi:hypothetical protein